MNLMSFFFILTYVFPHITEPTQQEILAKL